MASIAGDKCYNCAEENLDMGVISACQHRLCGNCLVDKDSIKKCDSCKAEKFVECINASDGCNTLIWRHKVDLLSSHTRTCEYKKLPCHNNCPERVFNRNLINHVNSECPKRILECSHCHNTFFAAEIEAHVTRCDHVLVKCEFCDEQAARKDMERHLLECNFAKWPCEWSTFGCEFKGTLQKHAVLNTHSKLMRDYIRRSEEDINLLREDVKIIQNEIQTLKENQLSSEDTLQVFKNTVRNLEDENESLKQDTLRTKEEIQCCREEVTKLNETVADLGNYVQYFKQQNETFVEKFTVEEENIEQLTKNKESMQLRLEADEREKEKKGEEFFEFCRSFRAELLEGLEVEDVATKDMMKKDSLLSSLELIKSWAVGIKYLQQFILSREDIFMVSDGGIRYFITINKRHPIFNLGIEEVPLFSSTYVVGHGCRTTWKEITSPHISVQLVVRFKFLIRKEEADVFAEVSYSKGRSVCIVFKEYRTNRVILTTALTDLPARVNVVPIFCGNIPLCNLSSTIAFEPSFKIIV